MGEVAKLARFHGQSPDRLDLQHLFASIRNPKDRALLMTAYAGVPRLGELIRLKPTDIEM